MTFWKQKTKNTARQTQPSIINPSVLSNVNADSLTHLESKMINEGEVRKALDEDLVKGLKQHRVMWRNLSYLWAQKKAAAVDAVGTVELPRVAMLASQRKTDKLLVGCHRNKPYIYILYIKMSAALFDTEKNLLILAGCNV